MADISFVAAPSVKVGESHGRQPGVEKVFCQRAALGGEGDRSEPDDAESCAAVNDAGGRARGLRDAEGHACSKDGCLFVIDINYDAAQASGVIPAMAVSGSPCALEG